MPFAYYARLSRRDRATYRRSDAITSIRIPASAGDLGPIVEALRAALVRDDADAVAVASAAIVGRIALALGAPAPLLAVLAVRPSHEWGELHGLYTPDAVARIRVWMRTARHGQVVAFRTFLRTLLHELCHHLDLEVLGLEQSFHTEGFFKRESSLFHQLVPEAARVAPRRTRR